MVSFDVTPLFISIPQGLAIKTIELLLQSKYDEKEDRLGHAQVLQLLNFCLRTYFTFDETIYERVNGTPMSSSIPGYIAEAVLQRLESLVFQHHKPKFCVQNEDDTFAFIDRGHLKTFKEHLNAVLPDMRFTMEEEENNKLPFLDVLVYRKDCDRLKTKVFRKATNAMQLLNFNSNHPISHKRSCNTQLDVISSVGKMAAPSDNFADANAFILTDEETLIPAAPPADEVTVVTALPSSEETAAAVASVIPCQEMPDSCPVPSPTEVKREPEEEEEGEDTKKALGEWSEAVRQFTEDTMDTILEKSQTAEVSRDSATSMNQYFGGIKSEGQLLEDIAVPSPCPADPDVLTASKKEPVEDESSQNMLVVETPDGRLLYVRQGEEFGTTGLGIFAEDGTAIEDESLLQQVVSAIAAFPSQTTEPTLGTESSTKNDLSENGIASNPSPLVSDHSASSARSPNTKTADLESILPENDKKDILAQLAQFASDHSQMGSSLCIDDPDYGSITFAHPCTDQQE
nr:unnamed protein product [Spirometra erinaceieuropaei]